MKKQQVTLLESLLPVLILIILLSFNIAIFGEDALGGSNQFILLIGAAVTVFIGMRRGFSYIFITKRIAKNIKSTAIAMLILLLVGSLSGTWLISGVIPAMIYYGLQILNPSIFLVACVFICILISISTGSSWTTSATVGIALIGIGNAMGIPEGMVAGAIISGAYFGDKISPLSETTNLASSIVGVDLFTHIKYLLVTTIPSLVITLMIFTLMGVFIDTNTINTDMDTLLLSIKKSFYISPILFVPPIIIITLIIKKIDPLVAILIGVLLGVVFALIFQGNIVHLISGVSSNDSVSLYRGIMNTITTKISIPSDNPILAELFSSNGMEGMLSTIWLIICAMTFGGALEGIGALKVITETLLRIFDSILGLFASTVISCMAINLTASDQYLSVILPGKMFAKSYQKKNLAPENLSRALEDSGTVVSPLIPWNTCGAFQSSTLGVSTLSYLPYAFFNIISPFMTIIIVTLKVRIKMLKK